MKPPKTFNNSHYSN